MRSFKHAFTMIELIFVIVILGILSAVAFPKLSGVTRDANLAQGMATVSSIRSAIISERQKNLIKGTAKYPDYLDIGGTAAGQKLFDGNTTAVSILQYPIYASTSQGGWMKTSTNAVTPITYNFYIDTSVTVQFTYTKSIGIFDCNHTTANCKEIVE